MSPDDLAALHARCFTEAPLPWSARAFAELLRDPACFCLQCEGGFALGRAVAGEAELLTICVDPAARLKGQGRKLLASFEIAALERKSQRAYLEVAEDNAAARALYETRGWAEIGRRKGYYRAKAGAKDAIVMDKML